MSLIKKKILIVDKVHDYLIEELLKLNFECLYLPELEDYKIANEIVDCFGLIVRNKKIDKAIIDGSNNLKFIARVGAGLENIDIEYSKFKNINCINSPEGNRDSVGEHTVGLLINLLHNINCSNNQIVNGFWRREENKVDEIENKVIGIIGYGNMGSAFAKRIKTFGTKVIAYDKYKLNYSDENVVESSLENFFEEVDIISLHVPLTDETNYLINSTFIEKFKKNIYIINTSRGKVINTNDLVYGLKSGKVLGAALDVIEYEESSFKFLANFENENFKYLLSSENVIITPHIAGVSKESPLKHAKVLIEKIKKIL